MAEQEVRSPVCRPGSKVGSGQPISPGARSNPSRGSGPQTDFVPPQPSRGGASRHSEPPIPTSTKTVVGPAED
jgi:hypothetical protein